MFVRKAHSFKTSYTLRPLFTEGMHLLVFMSVLYAVGFVIGLVIYYSFPTSLQNGFIVRIHEAIVSLLTGSTVPHVVITESTVELLLLFFLWIFAQTSVGTPFIVGLLFLRAVSAGLTFLAIMVAFGLRGFGFDLLAIAPSNILTGGSFILAATVGLLLIRHSRKGGKSTFGYPVWVAYHGAVLVAAVVLLCSGKLETAATMHALGWLALSPGR
ncbi:hypothetical protein [Sulfoacidibacillus ferrooxidans]|uniref:Uncharacterized protein n=1 Tax=Sulfoacidibacillus ferrooxidans TaxID=2005001 RepID=A0A9X1VA80_9BACL|nr:hypothetical protein [Sulfoacidibacillus ferrooxidans]MCI0184109.1 hypothetical protein [Sulfoacidibacillus ferrooxidans]